MFVTVTCPLNAIELDSSHFNLVAAVCSEKALVRKGPVVFSVENGATHW